MRIDLNADLGEGFGVWRLGDDDAVLDVVTSANVACGFHAGDPLTMRRVCAGAVRRGVVIGAQVGYRDLAGFGRRRIDIEPAELAADVLYQLGALHACAVAAGGRVAYVKPHGALYNTAADDVDQADALVSAVADFDPGLAVLGPPASRHSEAAARHGLRFVSEAFADRGYLPSGRLVPRNRPGSLITDPDAAAARALRLVREGRLVAVDGTDIEVNAESLCVHGDTPRAVAMCRAVLQALEGGGVDVAAFAG